MAEVEPIRIGYPYTMGVRIRLSEGVYVNPNTPGVELRSSLTNGQGQIVANFAAAPVSTTQFGLTLTGEQTAALSVGILEGDIACYRDGFLHWENEFSIPVRKARTPPWP